MTDAPSITERRLVISRQNHQGQYFSEALDANIHLDMMWIPGGAFLMGSSEDEQDSEDSERPQHLVRLSSFFMARTPVTQQQWKIVADYPIFKIKSFEDAFKIIDPALKLIKKEGLRTVEKSVLKGFWESKSYQEISIETNYHTDTLKNAGYTLLKKLSYLLGENVKKSNAKILIEQSYLQHELEAYPSHVKADNHPVDHVNWDDATEFCRRLSFRTGRNYHLPTEAEWEYACRAHTQTPFHVGETLVDDLANYDARAVFGRGFPGLYREESTEVASFPANAFGLYDMHGNVEEWCEDDWHDSYSNAPDDGSAWTDVDRSNKYRVRRGGSWKLQPQVCRSAYRYGSSRHSRHNDVGFRVCCEPPDYLRQDS